MHWEALLQEVLNKASKQDSLTSCLSSQLVSPVPKKEYKKFFLGVQYRGIYFTSREAEVMVHLLQGKTVKSSANILRLSPRTVEFYVKNMKIKLGCRTKSELIGKVFASDFVKHVDFIASLIE
jgi:DNA-binding CsgD family transcriptional regulator